MVQPEFEIRSERPGDEAAIREVTRLAFESSDFGHNGEAALVDALREVGAATISLVAECEDQIVGHILFSPATIEWHGHRTKGLGLAPVSVIPDFRNRGIGSWLIAAGMHAAAESVHDFAVVLGHFDRYHQFGFISASKSNVACEFDGVPEENFLIRWFNRPEPSEDCGVAKYHSVFSTLG